VEFWIEHLHPDDRGRVLGQREELHEGRLERLSIEYRYLHPAHGEKWLHHASRVTRRDATGRVVKTFGVLRDITERKRAEDESHDLSRRLIGAHEEERALLARELHDDVSQRLAVLAIDVGRAELAAPDREQTEAMTAVREGLTRLSEDIHSLAYQLHPSVLEELGLDEALRAECERRGRQGALDISVDLGPLPAVVGKGEALCLFRVAQEALNNVARHAGARAASVTLREMDDGLLLAVRDDGVGFDPENPRKGMRLGLVGMRERVRLVQGTLDVESAPGRGTTIVAWVPAEAESR
jgi:signal transduction histidine kinase